jgi:hypothetical protein
MITSAIIATILGTGLYLGMKRNMITFGIDAISQRKDHESKQWKVERSRVPVRDSAFEVETEVKWCPATDEIFYKNPKSGGMLSKDWIEIDEYTDLYKKLRSNFRKKYLQTSRPKQGRRWTAFNQ